MVRSPSHESIEASLLSLSNLGPFARIPSPIHRLAVPNPPDGSKSSIFADEENDLIKNFGALFKFLGSKSFSTSDISTQPEVPPRKSSSELDLTQSDVIFRIPSRSCSTRVFVGDVPSSSQLPSPQGRLGSFTTADLVRTVNKKVRQIYIRKRLSVAYKLTQSGFDLVNLVPPRNAGSVSIPVPESDKDQGLNAPVKKPPAKELTLKDVERERGRPLSKLERNIFIFNWLHSLDESYEAVE
jgi:hypothetical protein